MNDGMNDDNPYELLDLDPTSSVEELTEELRRRVERANPEERQRIQRAWRQLTMKDEERIRIGFLTHPRVDSGLDPISKLRDAVPPYISRRRPDRLIATVADAIAGPEQPGSAPSPPNPWRNDENPSKP